MDIEVLELKETSMKFILRNSTPALANALRRTIISDIPKLAIDSVEFFHGIHGPGVEADSKTPLFDEVIAHRLGQIPLPTVEGVETANYSLGKVGPCMVYSGDLQVWDASGKDDVALAPVDKNIPIVELADKQAIQLTAIAVRGTAKKHAKWQVANAVGYRYRPIVKIVGDIRNPEEIEKACPKKVFAVEGGKLVVKNEINCSLCMTCVEQPFKKDAITIKGDDKSFVFTFETDGSLTAQQVLDKATEILAAEAKAIADKVASF